MANPKDQSSVRASALHRTQGERSSTAKARLIDAAIELVATHGLERFTLADVGERAGYSRAHPAKYFGTKQGLVAALLNVVFAPPAAVGEPGFETLLKEADAYFDRANATAERCLLVVLGEALTSEPVRERIKVADAALIARIESHIAAGIAVNEVASSVKPKPQALLVLSGMRAAMAQWLMDPKSADLADLREEFVMSLRFALAASG
jgi:AcrR family transcriptional regulator